MEAFVESTYGPQKPYRPQREGYVYFVQEEGGGPIKIGWATNPSKRLSGMQSGNPRRLRLIGAIAGERNLEGKLHTKFAKFRQTGEWFEPHPTLLAYIAKRTIQKEAA